MTLTIKTDSPVAELELFDGSNKKADKIWQADRQLAKDLLKEIEQLLKSNGRDLKDLTGLIVFMGPGSFTGLRIGITVANAIAYGQSINVVGEVGSDWLQKGLARLERGENDKIIMPAYGADAKITTPR